MQKSKFIAGPDDNRELPQEDHNTIGVVEFSQNIDQHYAELEAFADTHNVSLSRAASHYIERADDSEPGVDVVPDVLSRAGVRLVGDEHGPASPTVDLFTNEALAAFATQYVQDGFFYQIHDDRFWNIGRRNTSLLEFAQQSAGGATRGGLPSEGNAFNPPTVGSIMPDKVLYQDLEIADITGDVREIRGSKYTGPKVTEPDDGDYKLTGIGEFGSIPEFTIGLGEDTTETSKAGYSTKVSYEFLRTGGETIEGLMQHAMWMGFLTTAEVVNEGIILALSSGAKPYNQSGSAELDRKKAIKMLAQRTKGTQFSIVIGNLEFFVEYAAVDWTFNSNNNAPLVYDTPQRVFLNTPMGRQQITYRSGDEVPALAGDDPKGGLWDMRFVLRYIFERNSNIEEQSMNRGEQAVCFYRTFNYAWQLMQMANDARMIATLSS